jgi:hypothetical protein
LECTDADVLLIRDIIEHAQKMVHGAQFLVHCQNAPTLCINTIFYRIHKNNSMYAHFMVHCLDIFPSVPLQPLPYFSRKKPLQKNLTA